MANATDEEDTKANDIEKMSVKLEAKLECLNITDDKLKKSHLIGMLNDELVFTNKEKREYEL